MAELFERKLECPLGHQFEVGLKAMSTMDSGKTVSIETLRMVDSPGPYTGEGVYSHEDYFVCPECGIVFRPTTRDI